MRTCVRVFMCVCVCERERACVEEGDCMKYLHVVKYVRHDTAGIPTAHLPHKHMQ